MYKVIVFAGTTEGNEICQFLEKNQIRTYACVATEYGSRSLQESAFLTIAAGRMQTEEMKALFLKEQPEMILDATHPYATEVTQNIRTACEETGCCYYRVLRKSTGCETDAVYVENIEAAVAYLEATQGNILLTTGSKELERFTSLTNYRERLYARVLSLTSVFESCQKYGIEGKHLIGMQGPFSVEMNEAMIRQFDCRYLVTKDTGKAGGMAEKLEAAQNCKITAVIIGRPVKEEGMSVVECKKMLAEHFHRILKPSVALLGIGMGRNNLLTKEAEELLQQTDLLIGAKRIVDAVRQPHQEVCYEYQSKQIAKYIDQHPEYNQITVVLSGDVGFYSAAKSLLPLLGEDVRLVCGISSVVYFMSKIGLSWDDAKIVSNHGQNCNLIPLIRQYKKVFSILGSGDTIGAIARKLVYYDMPEVLMYVGENLSYENEKILVKKAKDLTSYQGDSLAVVCICNEQASQHFSTHGIPDACFIRGKAPMTKEEVRTVSLSKMRLMENSICYDVGAGTGSVSIEMALRAHQGQVFAIEKKEDALHLLEKNKQKFAADNLEIIPGEAPMAMEALPTPSHVFIGGSSGNLKKIAALAIQKNPNVRIVINCITLETLTETMQLIQEMQFQDTEIVQLSVSQAKELGKYHLMMGENPIYIITCQNPTV